MRKAKLQFCAKRQKVLAFRAPPAACGGAAFTLVELLTVLAIMAIIAALTVPALKNFGHADAMTAADQQMVGAVARARQLAMSQRTTVYMVFVPPNFWTYLPATVRDTPATTNLCGDQLTGYNFLAHGAMGDQPGRHQWHYLEKWQRLPAGTFIAQQKFITPPNPPGVPTSITPHFYISAYNPAIPIYGFTTNAIPFPTADSPLAMLPCVAFNYLGQMTFGGQTLANRHEYIPLARGVVAPAANPDTKAYQLISPTVIERPPGNSTNAYNIINIDPLTGRATLETPKIQ